MIILSILWKVATFPFKMLFGNNKKNTFLKTNSPFARLIGFVNFLLGSFLSGVYVLGVATISRLVDQGIIQNWLTTHTPALLTTPITINVFGILVGILNSLLAIADFVFSNIVKFVDFLLPQYHNLLSAIPHIPHAFGLPEFLSKMAIITQKTVIDLFPFVSSLDQLYSAINLNIGIVAVALFTCVMVTLIYLVFAGTIPNRIARFINWLRYKKTIKTLEKSLKNLRQLETRTDEVAEYDRMTYLIKEINQEYKNKGVPVI